MRFGSDWPYPHQWVWLRVNSPKKEFFFFETVFLDGLVVT